jgi:hypothetical protein
MFKPDKNIQIIPKLLKTSPKTTMIIFFILDLLPHLLYGYYFALLTIFEIYIFCSVGFNFTDLRYERFAIIRLIFYFVSLVLLGFLVYYRIDKSDSFLKYLFEIAFAFFIVWNLYMTFKFKKVIGNLTQIEGYLGDEENFENYLDIKGLDEKKNNEKNGVLEEKLIKEKKD